MNRRGAISENRSQRRRLRSSLRSTTNVYDFRQLSYTFNNTSYPDRGPSQHHRPILDILRDYGMWVTDHEPEKVKPETSKRKRKREKRRHIQAKQNKITRSR